MASNEKSRLLVRVAQSAILPLAGIFLLTLLLVPPRGEFPLEDDWVHVQALQRLVDEGTYRGHPFVAATLVAQIYWGALFCKLLGFSFLTLRISTMVLSLAGAWATAKCGRAYGLPPALATICGVLLFVHPFYLNLTYTFMTDVPFIALTVLSGLFYLHAFKTPSARYVFLGSAFAVLSYLVRQFGVFIPAAYVCAAGLLWLRKEYRITWRIAAAFVLPWVAALVLTLYLDSVCEKGTPMLTSLNAKHAPLVAVKWIRFLAIAFCYLGLFALPLSVGWLWARLGQGPRPARWKVLGAGGFCAGSVFMIGLPRLVILVVGAERIQRAGFDPEWWLRWRIRMPFLSDFLRDLGVGPLYFKGAPAVTIGEWWWGITAVCLASGSIVFMLLASRLLESVKPHKQENSDPVRRGQAMFLIFWSMFIVVFAFNPWRARVIDRYLLPAVPPLALLLARELFVLNRKSFPRLPALCCACVYLFGLVCLQDFMAIQRARWEAVDYLINNQAVSVELIDGGYEYNGWHTSKIYNERFNTKNLRDHNQTGLGWWILDDTYRIVRDAPQEGYEEFAKFPYFSWLGLQERTVRIYKRIDN